MTYACPAWEFAADIPVMKLQCLQNKVLRTIGKFRRCTPVRELLMAFQVPYIYYFFFFFLGATARSGIWPPSHF
jgi:hypothetical protein